MALKPSHAWWHPEDVAGTLQDVAREAGWVSAEQPGKWVRITRTFRDGGSQQWWALEIKAGPYGPDKTERAVVATTDPQKLPDPTTWYLVTNLPAPTQHVGSEPPFPPANLEEVIRHNAAAYVGGTELQTHQTCALAGPSTRCAATRRSDGIGNSSAALSPFAGIISAIPLPARRTNSRSYLRWKISRAFLPRPREREKKISAGKDVRPQVSWPMALRAVRGWLEPWIMLRRYWSGWSSQPPPPAVQLLLRWVEKGHAIPLYSSA